jgi:predicted lipoprotein
MKQTAIIMCCVILAGALIWLFPLFHVVPIEQGSVARRPNLFNAAAYASAFWNERLPPALDNAHDAAAALKALREAPLGVREKFGRKVGVSRTRLILLRGSGKVVSHDKKGVGVALDLDKAEPDIVLRTGLLFGNAVRDASGLIDASSFANSQHFNEVSTELNRIVEARVLSKLKGPLASLDQHIEFVGCVEIQEDARIELPLTIVPLDVRARTPVENPLLSDSPDVR